jgi:dihydroorotate dehydrogenase (NAD+) catalytic subunit
MTLILSSGKRDFILDPPITNAAGILGFSDESKQQLDLSSLGAFVTNPISLNPRSVARPPRTLTFPGGFLLHTGHPNPGLHQVIQNNHRQWKNLPCPVIVHILGQNPEELAKIVERLEEVDVVAAVEVGLEPSDATTISDLTTTAVMSELPIIAHLPLDCNEQVILAVAHAGASALSLGPPRGSLPGSGGVVSGRLYGPALFPLALRTVMKLSGLIDIPIIASGGVSTLEQIQVLLEAGAQAVQLDSVLWTEPDRVLSRPSHLMKPNDPT